jgi:hypothetical protein
LIDRSVSGSDNQQSHVIYLHYASPQSSVAEVEKQAAHGAKQSKQQQAVITQLLDALARTPPALPPAHATTDSGV